MSNNNEEGHRFGPKSALAVTLATMMLFVGSNWVIKKAGPNQNKIANSTSYDNSQDINEKTYYYSKEDFTRRLSQATGANNIEVKDASSYEVVTQTNNINGTTYGTNYYVVDGNVVFKEAYADTGTHITNIGVRDFKEMYSGASKIIVSIGEDGARVTKEIITGRDEMFGALEKSEEFVEKFAGDKNYWDAVAEYPLGDIYYCCGTTRLGKDGNRISTCNEYGKKSPDGNDVLFTQVIEGDTVIYQHVGPIKDQKVLAYYNRFIRFN